LQIATALALRELIFVVIFNDVGHFLWASMLAYTRLEPELSGSASIVIVAISWPHRPIRDGYRHHKEYCE
jgi:hypothetical protein